MHTPCKRQGAASAKRAAAPGESQSAFAGTGLSRGLAGTLVTLFGVMCSYSANAGPIGSLTAQHSGKCVTIPDGTWTAGARAVQSTCTDGVNQNFELIDLGDGFVNIRNSLTGQCLHVASSSQADLAPVVQWPCIAGGYPADKWRAEDIGGGTRFIAAHSGKCLNVYGYSHADGTHMIQYQCEGGANEIFSHNVAPEPANPPPSGPLIAQHSEKCVAIPAGTITVDTQAVQWTCNDGPEQTFAMVDVGDGYVNIRNEQTGQCLNVSGASQANLAAVVQWPCTPGGHPNDKWLPEEINGGHRFIAAHSGKCLNVYGYGTGDGTKLIQYQCEGGANETFTARALAGLGADPVLASLKTATVPTPTGLSNYVKDQHFLEALGKALFWDNAAGFDGQACASCHFHAGVDSRIKNQISPHGASKVTRFDTMQTGQGGPNYTLKSGDFPLFKLSDPDDRHSHILFDTDDTVTSMGTFGASVDSGITTITGEDDECNIDPDIVFHVNGYNTRIVEPRNTPSTINAAFNFRQFWDGRANNEFNGFDPFGRRNPNARIVRHQGSGHYSHERVEMKNASLASQAVGPILSTVEMNCAGRQISHVGRKLLPRRALAEQRVSASDSVLASMARPDKGLDVTYSELVQNAFRDEWWNGTSDINGFSHMETNFSLFYGLALQAYQSTLISDDSRFDRYMDGDYSAMTDLELQGLGVFVGKGKCTSCHKGPELSSAATHLQAENQEGGLVERMQMATLDGATNLIESWAHCADRTGICTFAGTNTYRFVYTDGSYSPTRSTPYSAWCYEWWFTPDGGGYTPGHCEVLTGVREEPAAFVALYDNGFYNIGVTPTEEDIGTGGVDPWGNPLSWTRQAKFRAAGQTELAPDDFSVNPDKFEENPGTPVSPYERDAVDGSFKTPILRNVELTGPYMHNGDSLTLEQLVEFYNRGGNRRDTGSTDADGSSCDTSGFDDNCSNLDPDITSLDLSSEEKTALVAFLKALTDERVRYEEAPFDHPELVIPLGHVGDENHVETENLNGTDVARDSLFVLPAVGQDGRQPLGLGPIPEVKQLMDCSENHTVEECFVEYYGGSIPASP